MQNRNLAFALKGDDWTRASEIGRGEAKDFSPAVIAGIDARINNLGLTPEEAATARLSAIRHLSRLIADAE